MLIQWFGQACFKVQTKSGPNGEVTVIFDPFDVSRVGLALPKLTADVVAVSHDHFDHNHLAAVSGDYFLVHGPGEYEAKQTFFYGIAGWHDNSGGSERGSNTMYLLESEGISVAHLGDIGQTELTSEQLEYLEGADVLLIPVGGVYTVNAKQAHELINQIEPRIVIPMHYKLPGLKIELEALDKFVKELGLAPQVEEKLRLTKKDLPQEETKLVILKP
ncbi:MAG: MBL fold metallo-hydrolase [Candidatus Veblenbacteria bacterium]|nr:MBL fold metallo-hydrolase [Candidatus Veblenbacteria bacterium]MDZ4230121.1 MBL fold metallo-hydrolase [Candidatus Veblenbacteria bacterium]